LTATFVCPGDLIDRNLTLPFDPLHVQEVWMIPRHERAATGAFTARFQWITVRFTAQQTLCQTLRKDLLANSIGTDEQIRLRQSATLERTSKHLALLLVTSIPGPDRHGVVPLSRMRHD
jgi:hypothetical protein